jgi:hypothetical protein
MEATNNLSTCRKVPDAVSSHSSDFWPNSSWNEETGSNPIGGLRRKGKLVLPIQKPILGRKHLRYFGTWRMHWHSECGWRTGVCTIGIDYEGRRQSIGQERDAKMQKKKWKRLFLHEELY